MDADVEDKRSSSDHTDDDGDDKEIHKRKRASTRKVDLRILPLLSYVLDNDCDRMKFMYFVF